MCYVHPTQGCMQAKVAVQGELQAKSQEEGCLSQSFTGKLFQSQWCFASNFYLQTPLGQTSGVHRQNLSVVGAPCKQKCLSQGGLQTKSLSPGGMQIEMSVPGGIAGKTFCPKGAQQVEVSVSGGLQTKSVCLKGALQTKASVPGGLASQICLSWGCLQAEASVPGGIAGKTVFPKDALQVDASVSGGLQAKFVCPRDACRQKCLSQGVCRQNLSVLGVEQHGSNYCSASLSSIGGYPY